MAHFLGGVEGNKGKASREGSPHSGIKTFAIGWQSGIRVEGHVEGKKDVFNVFLTGGAKGGTEIHLLTIEDGAIYPVYKPKEE